ncbi:MAG: tyrosine-type recombinase/integrase [Planctomycetes bacterium]|nr:tyrosine-type recombinase/integrase [Planctomycetota bacterium]
MPRESSTALALVPRSISTIARAELPKYLTRDEVGRLIAVAKPGRDRLMLRVLWETGLRISELLALTAESVDFAGEALHVVTLKRHAHMRAVPLRPAVLGDLARHIAGGDFAGGARLFAITRQRAHQIVRRAALGAGLGADRAHPHTMRHSFAVACVLARVPVLVLAEWLGHRSLESTLVYTKVLCADSRRYLGDVDFG